MATEKVSQLPPVAAAATTDIIYAIQGGISVQETLQQVLNLGLSNTVLNFAGNPNTFVAGSTYQLLWDTTNNIMWVCTTSGNAAAAVWKPIIGQLTNGQMRIGSTGSVPAAATLTAGSGISIANGAGTITISVTGAGTTWTDVTGATQTLAVNNGYVADRGAGNVAFTLPTVASIGDTMYIVGRQNGWSVAQGAGQSIVLGTLTSTPGAGGSIASTNAKDCVTLVCTVANLEFTINAVVGIITVV